MKHEIEFTTPIGTRCILELIPIDFGFKKEVYCKKTDTYFINDGNDNFTHLFSGEQIQVTAYTENKTNKIKYTITTFRPENIRGQIQIN